MTVRILVGDCRDHMAQMEPNSIDACVTDPPYGLEFMGKEWDQLWDKRVSNPENHPTGKAWAKSNGRVSGNKGYVGSSGSPTYRGGAIAQAWHETWAREAYRVLKPGGYLLAFGGTRTFHRLTVAIEDVGFEIRDCLMWLYGSGFPKSLDVSKALDKAAGAEREVTGEARGHVNSGGVHDDDNYVWNPVYERRDAPATDLARQWDGWGTALKPAWEPIIVARKPLIGTVAANVTQYGTGGINVDGCRIGTEQRPVMVRTETIVAANAMAGESTGATSNGETTNVGRWPANVILDETAAALLDTMSGERGGSKPIQRKDGFQRFNGTDYNNGEPYTTGAYESVGYNDTGGASRFFYTAKSSRAERNKGLGDERNGHPTIKPLDLMQWLVRLVTPPGGTVLDPFMGSGSTGIAADREGFNFIGIEQDAEYAEIARRRIIGDAPLFANVEME